MAAVLGSESSARAALKAYIPFLDPDFEVLFELGGVVDVEPRRGAQGLLEAWLEWMEPWASYRTEIERMVDLGERVVYLARDYGRFEPDGPEVLLEAAAIWTVRDGKVVRAEFYANRDAALRAAGLTA